MLSREQLRDKVVFCADALYLGEWHSGGVWDVMRTYHISPPVGYVSEIREGMDKISFQGLFEIVLGDRAQQCEKIRKKGNVGVELFKQCFN